jgi:hypothetical protein
MAEPVRKFIYAADMEKLGDRITKAEAAIEEAREIMEDLGEADDLANRLIYLVLAIRDFRASQIGHDELYEHARRSLDGIRDNLPEDALAEIGPAFNRPSS